MMISFNVSPQGYHLIFHKNNCFCGNRDWGQRMVRLWRRMYIQGQYKDTGNREVGNMRGFIHLGLHKTLIVACDSFSLQETSTGTLLPEVPAKSYSMTLKKRVTETKINADIPVVSALIFLDFSGSAQFVGLDQQPLF